MYTVWTSWSGAIFTRKFLTKAPLPIATFHHGKWFDWEWRIWRSSVLGAHLSRDSRACLPLSYALTLALTLTRNGDWLSSCPLLGRTVSWGLSVASVWGALKNENNVNLLTKKSNPISTYLCYFKCHLEKFYKSFFKIEIIEYTTTEESWNLLNCV